MTPAQQLAADLDALADDLRVYARDIRKGRAVSIDEKRGTDLLRMSLRVLEKAPCRHFDQPTVRTRRVDPPTERMLRVPALTPPSWPRTA